MEACQDGCERDKLSTFSSSIPVITNFWKEFDLEKEKRVLHEQWLRVAESEEDSKKNQQKLEESMRDFEKASPEEKLSMFDSLLKGYHEEVDRAKFGKNAFLNIDKKLCEAPDPYPALASIVEQGRKLSELESEIRDQQATITSLEE